jgi:predicted nucleic acid-binding protein
MRPVLFDSDAFRCLHGLGLLDAVCAALTPHTRIVLTEYVARHELNLMQREIEHLERSRAIRVERLLKGTEAAERYRAFLRAPTRGERPDKGEAEAIAWALGERPAARALFVTRDDGARRFAEQSDMPVTDVMGIVVEACLVGALDRSVAVRALSVWDDRTQQRCRPADYAGFDATFAARERQRVAWCDALPEETAPASLDVN